MVVAGISTFLCRDSVKGFCTDPVELDMLPVLLPPLFGPDGPAWWSMSGMSMLDVLNCNEDSNQWYSDGHTQ